MKLFKKKKDLTKMSLEELKAYEKKLQKKLLKIQISVVIINFFVLVSVTVKLIMDINQECPKNSCEEKKEGKEMPIHKKSNGSLSSISMFPLDFADWQEDFPPVKSQDVVPYECYLEFPEFGRCDGL